MLTPELRRLPCDQLGIEPCFENHDTAHDLQAFLGHASIASTQVYMPKVVIERLRSFAGAAAS